MSLPARRGLADRIEDVRVRAADGTVLRDWFPFDASRGLAYVVPPLKVEPGPHVIEFRRRGGAVESMRVNVAGSPTRVVGIKNG